MVFRRIRGTGTIDKYIKNDIIHIKTKESLQIIVNYIPAEVPKMDALVTGMFFAGFFGIALILAFNQKPIAFVVGLLLTNIMGVVFTAIAYKLNLSAQVTALVLSGLLIANLALLFKKGVGIFWTVPINWVQFSQTGSAIDVLGSGQIMTLPQATLNKDDMRSLGTRPFRFSFEIERGDAVFIVIVSGSYKPGSDINGEQDTALVKYFQLGTEVAAYMAIGVELAGMLKPWIQEKIEAVADDQVRSQVHQINDALTREVDMIDEIESRNGIDLNVKLEDLALPTQFQEVRELRQRLKTVIDMGFWVHEQYTQRAQALDEETRKHIPGFDKLKSLIESLMAADSQGNVFAAKGGRGGQGVAPFALLNMAPRDPAGQGTPVVITNPEIKIPEKGATQAKAVVFTIAAIMALAVVVWNVLVIEKTFHSGMTLVQETYHSVVSAESEPPAAATKARYQKLRLEIPQGGTSGAISIAGMTIFIWPMPNLEVRTSLRNEWVAYEGDLASLVRGATWVEFRAANEVDRATLIYCVFPKNIGGSVSECG